MHILQCMGSKLCVSQLSMWIETSYMEVICSDFQHRMPQIARLTWPTWGPHRSCRSQVGPMLALWILLSGMIRFANGTPKLYIINSTHPDGVTHWYRSVNGDIFCSGRLNPSYYLNLYLNVYRVIRNRIFWNLRQHRKKFVHGDAFENVIYQLSSISFWPHCVNGVQCKHCLKN